MLVCNMITLCMYTRMCLWVTILKCSYTFLCAAFLLSAILQATEINLFLPLKQILNFVTIKLIFCHLNRTNINKHKS